MIQLPSKGKFVQLQSLQMEFPKPTKFGDTISYQQHFLSCNYIKNDKATYVQKQSVNTEPAIPMLSDHY